MAELLLELLSEEIPARMQARAADDLKRLVTEKLKEADLGFERADAYVTPRRLALVVDGLPERQPDRISERKGPRVGAPESAIQGFLKASGRTSLEQCERRGTGKGAFWFAVDSVAGQPMGRALVEILRSAISELVWPKSMRWSSHQTSWVRPVHSLLAAVDTQIVAVDIDLRSPSFEPPIDSSEGQILVAGRATRGHRFLAPKEFFVDSFADYKAKLKGG